MFSDYLYFTSGNLAHQTCSYVMIFKIKIYNVIKYMTRERTGTYLPISGEVFVFPGKYANLGVLTALVCREKGANVSYIDPTCPCGPNNQSLIFDNRSLNY